MKKEYRGNGKGMRPIVGYNYKKWNQNFDSINWGKSKLPRRSNEELFDADPNCKHEIITLPSGISCIKCHGWFCY